MRARIGQEVRLACVDREANKALGQAWGLGRLILAERRLLAREPAKPTAVNTAPTEAAPAADAPAATPEPDALLGSPM